MRDDDPISDDYYPLRWRVADVIEDVLLLHRRAVVGVLALLALGVILIGVFALGWGSSDTSETTTEGTSSTTTSDSIDDTSSTTSTSTTSTSSTSTSTTSTSTTTTSTTTTTVPLSLRAPESNAQLQATKPGVVIELAATEARITGGLTNDLEADGQLELARAIFPDLAVVDEQIVDDSFPSIADAGIVVRLSAADLFGYNSDALNPTYLPAIDQLAAAISTYDWSVEVSGHTDDTGPAPGNQRLSERRAAAAAQRLISQGAPAAQVTSVGRGEDQPVASNDSEAGRLANRRVEFSLTTLTEAG